LQTGYRSAFREQNGGLLRTPGAEIQIVVLDLGAVTAEKPATLFSGVSEGGKDAIRGDGIKALQNEGAVDCGGLRHGKSFLKRGIGEALT
jgi:hypothetical protein